MSLRSLIVQSIIVAQVAAYNNGLGATPPMGWNTWCTQDICGLIDRCTETEVKSVADALVSSGLRDAGYTYVNLDDCWADTQRDEQGRLQPQPNQFPSGMASLADYVHSLGLKLGLYTCVGTQTCKKNRPGSYGHFDVDANTFADWGVDFVKADFCHVPSNESANTENLYADFSRALNATGRPMLFSLCEWGNDDVPEWGGAVGQMYRIQMDHLPLWHYPPQAAGQGYGQGVADIVEWMGDLDPSKYTSQYSWMDPDFLMTLMLENVSSPNSGKTVMNFVESRTEFSFWSLWASPLIFATDPRGMSEEKRSILLNTEVIAVNQDPLFVGGKRLSSPSSFNSSTTSGGQAWAKPLEGGDVALILYNRGSYDDDTWGGGGPAVEVGVTWAELDNNGMPPPSQDFASWAEAVASGTGELSMRDLWQHAPATPTDPAVGTSAVLDPRDIQMLRVSFVPSLPSSSNPGD